LRGQAYRYRAFPLFTIPADTANAISAQAPVFLLSIFFGSATVGFFGMTQRVLAAPITFIGRAIQDVFRERAASDLLAHGDCSRVFLKTAKALALLGIVPFLVIQFAGPALFAYVFGCEWEQAGKFAQIMAVLYLLRIVVTPVASVLIVAEKQRQNLAWQIGLLLVTSGALLLGGLGEEPNLAVLLYTATYSLMYVVYFVLSYRSARVSDLRGVPQPAAATIAPDS
jgi:O-antigen/teichoic acid export membrane protein